MLAIPAYAEVGLPSPLRVRDVAALARARATAERAALKMIPVGEKPNGVLFRAR